MKEFLFLNLLYILYSTLIWIGHNWEYWMNNLLNISSPFLHPQIFQPSYSISCVHLCKFWFSKWIACIKNYYKILFPDLAKIILFCWITYYCTEEFILLVWKYHINLSAYWMKWLDLTHFLNLIFIVREYNFFILEDKNWSRDPRNNDSVDWQIVWEIRYAFQIRILFTWIWCSILFCDAPCSLWSETCLLKIVSLHFSSKT